MSQSTAKDRIMYALFNSTDAKISNDDILWAASHIPDSKEGESGEYKSNTLGLIKYDHENKDVYEAINLNPSNIDDYKKKVVELFADKRKISQAFERIMEENDEEMLRYLICEGMLYIRGRYSKDDTLSQLRTLLNMLKEARGMDFGDEDSSHSIKTRMITVTISSKEDFDRVMQDPTIPDEIKKQLMLTYLNKFKKDKGDNNDSNSNNQ